MYNTMEGYSILISFDIELNRRGYISFYVDFFANKDFKNIENKKYEELPTNLDSRLIQIPILMLFGVVSFGIYGFINYKTGNLTSLFDIKRRKK